MACDSTINCSNNTACAVKYYKKSGFEKFQCHKKYIALLEIKTLTVGLSEVAEAYIGII